MSTARFIEFGPEPNHHNSKRSRFNLDWHTLGLSNKNDDLDIIHDLNKYPYPIEDNRYEIVFASHVIEHLDDPLRMLKECRRILKTGGTCRMNAPDARTLCRGYLEGKCSVDVMVDRLRSYAPMLHKGGFDKTKLFNLFSEAGFSGVMSMKYRESGRMQLRHPYFNTRPQRSVFCEGVNGGKEWT